MHPIDPDEKASIVVHMKENRAKYVVTWFWMYRCIDFPTKISNLVFSEIIIMKNMKIRMSILQTTDFDETLSGPQSTHSKHILFSDDRNLTDRFFIHLRWRFLIILISKSTELLFRKINSENFIRKSIHLYIHNHLTTYFSATASLWAVIRHIHPTDHECKAAHKIQTQISKTKKANIRVVGIGCVVSGLVSQ